MTKKTSVLLQILVSLSLLFCSQTFLSVFHVQGEFGIIKEAEEEETDTRDKSGDSADTRDTPTDSPQHQPAGPVGFNKDRRRSSFSLAKLGNK